MKLRNSLVILCSAAFCFGLAVTGCNTRNNTVNPDDVTWTITFDSKGGSQVEALTVKDGETVTKPADPTRDNFSFVEWCEDDACVTPFNFETVIHANWTLYAKWQSSGGSGGGGGGGGGGQGGGGETVTPHGPEGSTSVSWYIVGSGSFSTDDWQISGGVQLFSNPGSEDKGCILSMPFEVGDLFKVTDGSTWFGYEKVDTWNDNGKNKGVTNFEGADDGYNGRNFKCTVAGTYNMYVNKSGTFWIEDAE